MIEITKQDLLSMDATQTIVVPVNTTGTMGNGFALAIRNRYPIVNKKYKEACKAKELTIGSIYLIDAGDRMFLLFPTKAFWGHDSKLEYLAEGLEKIVTVENSLHELGVTSLAFPLLGAGKGNLNFRDVMPLMISKLAKLKTIKSRISLYRTKIE